MKAGLQMLHVFVVPFLVRGAEGAQSKLSLRGSSCSQLTHPERNARLEPGVAASRRWKFQVSLRLSVLEQRNTRYFPQSGPSDSSAITLIREPAGAVM